MSWSENFPGIKVDELLDKAPNNFTNLHKPHAEQFEVARDLALVLIQSGVIGDPDKFTFTVNVSGHGNTDHEPDPAWANDFVTINVYQKDVIDGGSEDQTT